MSRVWTEKQREAFERYGHNIIVSAAAGSGKTSVLSERVCQFVNRGGDLDRLIVVTFTNNAAGEMRSRIIKSLREKSVSDLPKDVKTHFKRQVIKANQARISTIDSFFISLVRENFKMLGISPNFAVAADKEQNASLRNEALDTVYSKALEKADPSFFTLMDMIGNGEDGLKRTVNELSEKISCVPFGDGWLEETIKKYDDAKYFTDEACAFTVKLLGQALETWEDFQDSQGLSEKNEAAFHVFFDYVKEIYEYALNNDWDNVCSLAVVKPDYSIRVSKNDDKGIYESCKSLRTLIDNFLKSEIFFHSASMVEKELNSVKEPMKELCFLIRDFRKELRALCDEKNMYPFFLITEMAFSLTVSSYDRVTGEYEITEVAQQIKDSCDEIMIDEYQDTNPIQDLIFTAIGDGKLFVVGDVKQAIYGFRGSDTKGFTDKCKAFDRIDLNKNFRSREGVLDFSNFVFKRLLSENVGQVSYSSEEQLNFGRKDCVESSEPDVEIDVLAPTYENLDSDKKYLTYLNEKIIKLLSTPSETKGGKCYTPSDIAVMFATKKEGMAIENSLRSHKIPSFFDKGSSLLESVEAQNVIAVLTAIADPYDDINLYAAMTGPMFDITEREIAECVIKGKERFLYQTVQKNKDLNGKIDSFLKCIEKWRSLSANLPLSRIIRDIYDETQYPEKVFEFIGGALRNRNLMGFFNFALNFDTNRGGSLSSFLEYIRDIEEMNESGDSQVAAPQGEYVHLMTYHGSKGLEYPVCIIVNAEKGFFDGEKSHTPSVNFNSRLGLGTYLINEEATVKINSFVYSLIEKENRLSEISEKLRTLYVAFTRAKEKLIIEMEGTNKFPKSEDAVLYKKAFDEENNFFYSKALELSVFSSTNYRQLLSFVLPHRRDGGLFNAFDVPSDSFNCPIKVNSLENSELNLEEMEDGDFYNCNLSNEELSRRLEFSYDTPYSKLPAKISVTELAKGFISDEDAEPLIPCKKGEGITPEFLGEKSMSGAERGTAIHRFVALADLENDLSDELNDLKHRGMLTQREADSIDIKKVEDFVNSDLYALYKKADKVYKEEPFVVSVPVSEYDKSLKTSDKTILLQGAIDALCEFEDGFVLVDYKSDRKSPEQLIETYSSQLSYYAMAVEKLFGKPVKEAYIWSFGNSRKVKILDNK